VVRLHKAGERVCVFGAGREDRSAWRELHGSKNLDRYLSPLSLPVHRKRAVEREIATCPPSSRQERARSLPRLLLDTMGYGTHAGSDNIC